MTELLSRLEIAVLAGVVAAALLVFVARRFGRQRELAIYGFALFLTAVAYLFFGMRWDAPVGHLAIEAVGAVLFTAAAVAGVMRRPIFLAVGWTAHVAWDLFFHHAGGPAFAPAGYPLLCVGFDLFLGGYIAGIATAPAGGPRRVAGGTVSRAPTIH